MAPGPPALTPVLHDPSAEVEGEASAPSAGPQPDLRASESHYRSIIDALAEGVIIRDAEGAIVSINESALRIFGLVREAAMGKALGTVSGIRVIHEDGSPMGVDEWPSQHTLRTGEARDNVVVGIYNIHSDLTWVSLNTRALRDPQGNGAGGGRIVGVVTSLHDITRLKQNEQRLLHITQYDLLTGLPSQTYFADRVGDEAEHCEAHGDGFGVLFLDLDRFAAVNDSLGHALGDEVLKECAIRLRFVLTEASVVARFSGDQFAILIGSSALSEIGAIAERLLVQVQTPFAVAGTEVYLSASIGVTLFPRDGHDAITLLKNAELALYRAKSRGRARYEYYTPDLGLASKRRLELDTQLRRALQNHEFVLHFQPQINIRSGRITGFEALIRWQHPDEGMILPSNFIPLLEDTGLIVPVGEWVLRTAAQQLKVWHDAGWTDLLMSANLSPRQFQQRELIGQIQAMIAEVGVAPERFELEITESITLTDPDGATETLHRLRALGLRLAIDDFGTGYSNLGYLKRFPVQRLKIDQSFVQDILVDGDDAAIVSAIVAMGKNLRLELVAEGVETAEQLAFLRGVGCELYQGYLYSAAMNATDATAMLNAIKTPK